MESWEELRNRRIHEELFNKIDNFPIPKDGEKGDKGDTGEKGEKGDKGDKGESGVNGVDGLNGISVSREDVKSLIEDILPIPITEDKVVELAGVVSEPIKNSIKALENTVLLNYGGHGGSGGSPKGTPTQVPFFGSSGTLTSTANLTYLPTGQFTMLGNSSDGSPAYFLGGEMVEGTFGVSDGTGNYAPEALPGDVIIRSEKSNSHILLNVAGGTSGIIISSSGPQFPSGIYRANGYKAINVTDLQLLNNDVTSVDWQSRTLNDSAGNASVDYDNRILTDSGFSSAINWTTASVMKFPGYNINGIPKFTNSDGTIDYAVDGTDYWSPTTFPQSNITVETAESNSGITPVADGTYTVGIGIVTNGTITIKSGIITAIQEAS